MNSLTSDSKLVRSSDLVASEMDGDLVMMSIERGQYFGISGVGLRAWALLEQPVALGQIVRTICDEYEIDQDTCSRDMLLFANDLLRHGVARLA